VVAFRQERAENGSNGIRLAVPRTPKAEERPEGYLNRITSFDEASGIGVMAVSGVMGKGLSLLETMCGGVDMNDVHDGLQQLAGLKPQAVQLYLNTPGGSAMGTQEAAAVLEEFAANVAPVHAYIDRLSASGGAWLGSGATTIHAAPTATVGSIGVYSVFFDQSQMLIREGVKPRVFTSGALKGAGADGTLTPAQAAEKQRTVLEIAERFYAQMQRRQPAGRAALDPAVHFTGGHWQAQSAAGMALHDGLVIDRQTHLNGMMMRYGTRRK
jgi:protease-4